MQKNLNFEISKRIFVEISSNVFFFHFLFCFVFMLKWTRLYEHKLQIAMLHGTINFNQQRDIRDHQ